MWDLCTGRNTSGALYWKKKKDNVLCEINKITFCSMLWSSKYLRGGILHHLQLAFVDLNAPEEAIKQFQQRPSCQPISVWQFERSLCFNLITCYAFICFFYFMKYVNEPNEARWDVGHHFLQKASGLPPHFTHGLLVRFCLGFHLLHSALHSATRTQWNGIFILKRYALRHTKNYNRISSCLVLLRTLSTTLRANMSLWTSLSRTKST